MSPAVTLSQATALVDAALARGAELGLAPLTVAVLDPGGRIRRQTLDISRIRYG